jgi:glutamate-ammonia-ligase adenylyltransferase
LLDARPAFLDLLARLFTLAPRLAEALARRPALLDALIEPRFGVPLAQDEPDAFTTLLGERLSDATSFEAKLNAARRFQREEAFRVAVQVLEGAANAQDAGAAYAELAEACVRAMADAALSEVQRMYGPQPGAFVVLALGKFGGRELTEGSDLDVMLVYDAPADADNARLTAGEYYARVTQRLISALSAPTEEGELYEIDTKLRPSGSKGPVAVRLSSFERYYAEEAWTWELQALTRLRVVAGDDALARRVLVSAQASLALPRDADKIFSDVAQMRGLMERERNGRNAWDLKLAPGGFVDIEFIAQALQLTAAALTPGVLSANSGDALDKLAAAGALTPNAHARLSEAWRLLSDLQQVLRICVAGDFNPTEAPEPLRARLTALAGASDFEALEQRLRMLQMAVRADFVQIVGPLGDGSQSLGR